MEKKLESTIMGVYRVMWGYIGLYRLLIRKVLLHLWMLDCHISQGLSTQGRRVAQDVSVNCRDFVSAFAA